jgi:hypothetical protein
MATELSLVAKYTSFVKTAADILRFAQAKQWAPAEAEFLDVARQGGSANVRAVGDILGFLGALRTGLIGGQKGKPLPPSSLYRVNLFAHGTISKISLNGKVRQPKGGAGIADVTMADENGSIDSNSLDALENTPDEQRAADSRVFARGGGIFLYACESGVSGEILQRLANAFHVNTYGFQGPIEYCPRKAVEPDAGRIPRGDTGLLYKLGEGRCDAGGFDFHKLNPSATRSPQAEQPLRERKP